MREAEASRNASEERASTAALKLEEAQQQLRAIRRESQAVQEATREAADFLRIDVQRLEARLAQQRQVRSSSMPSWGHARKGAGIGGEAQQGRHLMMLHVAPSSS